MKHILVLLFILLISGFLYAQKTIQTDAVIITKQNDTIKTGILVSAYGYGKDLLVAGSRFEKRIYFSAPTDKRFIKSTDVKYLEFELQGNKIIFVSKELAPELNYKNPPLFQQVQVGKLNWYKSFYWDSYNYTENTVEHFFLTGQEVYQVGLFNSLKNKLKKVTLSRPDLLPEIEAINGSWVVDRNKGISKVVTAYNEK